MAKSKWIDPHEARKIIKDIAIGKKIVEVSKKYRRSRFTIMNLLKGEQKFLNEKLIEDEDYSTQIGKDYLRVNLKREPKEVEKPKMVRPPAVYSNPNYNI